MFPKILKHAEETLQHSCAESARHHGRGAEPHSKVQQVTASKRTEDTNHEKPDECLKTALLQGVFAEDSTHKPLMRRILDPRGPSARRWNKVYMTAIMASLFIDPLFFFSPRVHPTALCTEPEVTLDTIFTILRSLNDVFYWVHIFVKSQTAYVAPSSRVSGRGELIIDPWKIKLRYLKSGFWIDFLAALPVPQALVWAVIPNAYGSVMNRDSKLLLRFVIFFQYLYRLRLLYPLSKYVVNTTGVTTEKAWLRAAYDLLLFYVASQITGACWYLFTIERQVECWKDACGLESNTPCQFNLFDCSTRNSIDPSRSVWLAESSNVSTLCDPKNGFYQFGIYDLGVTTGASSSSFPYKYTYSLWIGLQAIGSTGQTFMTSIYIFENIFSIIVGALGLLLIGLHIANMQRYLQAMTARLEAWRLKRSETKEWMGHRHLPPDLMQQVHKYDQHKWLATRGIDEEILLSGFPMDLQREIKRHLCLSLVRQVPMFVQMDEITLDAICEKLKPAVYPTGTFLVHEGDPVSEIFFIIRGSLDSYTTGGGREGFFNTSKIGPGGFCGEELLTWALDDSQSQITSDSTLPSSTRTVKAISDLEAFCLKAQDLMFVTLQFRKLHSRELRNKFRFYSQQWRTWGACYIQTAWRRFKKRKELSGLTAAEYGSSPGLTSVEDHGMGIFVPRPSSGIEVYAARLITEMRRDRERSKRFSGEES